MMILLWFPLFIAIAESRGPHHPRGEKIVKHHVHYRPTRGSEKLTQDVELLQDKAHIEEHLEGVIEQPDLSNMSEKELEFYYFQVHDTDNNSKLDGLEILQAIYHTKHDNEGVEDEEKNFEYYVDLIDRVLDEDDVDKDGYLTYIEFTAGRQKEVLSKKQEPIVELID